MDKSVVLLTGASGFLGSAIARAGSRTRTLEIIRMTRSPRGQADRYGDLTRPASLEAAIRGATHVIHAAGLAHVRPRTAADIARFHATNAEGTKNIAAAARNAGVQQFVLVSSVAVYGTPDGLTDESAPCRPQTPYGESKLDAEHCATREFADSATRLSILRMTTVYGEEDPGNVGRLMRAIDRRRFVWIGDGRNSKSLIYRDDAARACIMALRPDSASLEIFNVSAEPVTMRAIVFCLAAHLGRRVADRGIPASALLGTLAMLARVNGDKSRPGRFHETLQKWLEDDVYSGERFMQSVGFRPETPLAEGLRREVDWYRAHGNVSSSKVRK